MLRSVFPGCLWEPGVLVLTWHGLVRVAAGSSGWVAWAVCSSEGPSDGGAVLV